MKIKNITLNLHIILSILICVVGVGFVHGNVNRTRIYDENDNLVREELTESGRNGNVQTFRRLTHHYRGGRINRTESYLRTIENTSGYSLREEIFGTIDKAGDKEIDRIRRNKQVTESIPGGEEETTIDEDMDGDNNYRSYQKQVERNTERINEDGRPVQVYERLRFDREGNKTHHYERKNMSYENQRGIQVNQVVENNYDREGNLDNMKITRRFEEDGVNHEKVEHSHFDNGGSIESREVVETERWREGSNEWKEVRTTRNYEGRDRFLNETRQEKNTISRSDVYKEIVRVIRKDQHGSIVEETKNEEIVEKEPVSGYDSGTRTVTVNKTYDGRGREQSREKVIEEDLERHLGDRNEEIYRRKVLDENENVQEEREDKTINYHSGELQRVEKRHHVRGERLVNHWRKEIRSAHGERTEVLINYDERGNEKSRNRTVRDTL